MLMASQGHRDLFMDSDDMDVLDAVPPPVWPGQKSGGLVDLSKVLGDYPLGKDGTVELRAGLPSELESLAARCSKQCSQREVDALLASMHSLLQEGPGDEQVSSGSPKAQRCGKKHRGA
jgi:hypothetical protein